MSTGTPDPLALQQEPWIGYNRPTRKIEAMDAAGVVSSMNSNGSRDVMAELPPSHRYSAGTHVLRIAAVAALLILCLDATAEPAATARLGVLLQDMRQFEAGFHQKLIDENGDLLQESDGRVSVMHPGRFRWETTEPFAQLVVSDGTSVWQYDPDLQQAVKRPLDQRADQVPSMLLSGDIEAVGRIFDIRKAPGDGKDERFDLHPLKPGGPFSELSISFRDNVLQQLTISDGMGQRTDVSFASVRQTDSADVSQFEFVAPAGVDVVIDD